MSQMKAGFGKAKNMNGMRLAKPAPGAVRKGFGKAGTGTKGAANKGYRGGSGTRVGPTRG